MPTLGVSPSWAVRLILAALVLLVGLPATGVCQSVVVQIDEEVGGSGLDYDDPCFWRHPDDPDESLLLVTEKQGPAVDVFRLDTGEFVTSVTGFQRPNNCDVSGDLLVTTDRDADAVVVHSIPDFSLVGVIDQGFSKPMGVTVLHHEGRRLAVVADDVTLDLHIHDVDTGELVERFSTGFSSIEGVAADDLYERIYVAQDAPGGGVRVFSVAGDLIADFDRSSFSGAAEGVAVYRCGVGGWIVVSDQRGAAEFEVFDRRTLVHVGTFLARNAGGTYTSATDGIDVFQTATTRFPAGVFAACDRCGTSNDEVDVVSWDRIADALGLAVCPDGRPPNCGNGVVDSIGEECDGGDDDACPGLCGGDCVCGGAPATTSSSTSTTSTTSSTVTTPALSSTTSTASPTSTTSTTSSTTSSTTTSVPTSTTTTTLPPVETMVSAGSPWWYDDTGVDRGTGWRAVGFDDGSWAVGAAQLGYGDDDETTVLSFGGNSGNKIRTYYFRREFSVADPGAYADLTLRVIRDDGAVVYLNDVEVARSNMPAGAITFDTFASSAIGGADENAWQEFAVDPAVLQVTNMLAVEIHQANATSSDLSFDLELEGRAPALRVPVVSLDSPADESVVNSTAVSFTCSASDAVGLQDVTLHAIQEGGSGGTVIVSGPAAMVDAQISADTPNDNFGGGASINVDGQGPHAHAVIQVPALIGSGANQVPPGAVIESATLEVNCTNLGNLMKLYRLLEDWVESEVTWNQRRSGVTWTVPGADGPGSNAGLALDGDCTVTGQRTLNITSFVQEWSNGAPNHGLVVTDGGTNGVDFDSSESANAPVLTVVYQAAGGVVVSETQAMSGTSDTATFLTTLDDQQTYQWNCEVTNAVGGQAFAPADLTVTADTHAPDVPLLITPAEGASDTSTSPTLEVLVSDPDGDTLDVNFHGVNGLNGEEFTVVVLPDTQRYSESFPDIYTSQTQWIVGEAATRNIVFVTHEGDIVQNAGILAEWQRADASMSLLDGVVPYGMGPGNHDQPTTLFNQFFPFTRYEHETWYGGHYADTNDNNFELFTAGGMDFIVIHLDFCPSAGVIAWADGVLKSFADHRAIITTHGFLDGSGNRNVHACGSTQYIWDGLVLPNPNVHFVLSGHVHAEAARTDIANGHAVYQLLADYQDLPSGGEGWLRIMRFVPSEDRVYVETYSPWLDAYERDADSEFTVDFEMRSAVLIGAVSGVSSGDSAAVTWPDLAEQADYEWFVTVTDTTGRMQTGPVWRFTTGSPSSTTTTTTVIPTTTTRTTVLPTTTTSTTTTSTTTTQQTTTTTSTTSTSTTTSTTSTTTGPSTTTTVLPTTTTSTTSTSTTTTTTQPGIAPGDVIIAGFQAWNRPSGQNPGEFVELFNTTDRPVSLEDMELISRVDNNADGVVDTDWQLANESPNLIGKSIAPHSFFLIAESGVAALSGVHDIQTAMNLATGEGGSSERAIALELVIDGVHMDYVLYGRHDGSDTGANPDGDVPFDGVSFPRDEVIRNTRGTNSFQEGLVRRESAEDLYAGHTVLGFYTDEAVLGDGNPTGVWTGPHNETNGSYEARNSLWDPVLASTTNTTLSSTTTTLTPTTTTSTTTSTTTTTTTLPPTTTTVPPTTTTVRPTTTTLPATTTTSTTTSTTTTTTTVPPTTTTLPTTTTTSTTTSTTTTTTTVRPTTTTLPPTTTTLPTTTTTSTTTSTTTTTTTVPTTTTTSTSSTTTMTLPAVETIVSAGALWRYDDTGVDRGTGWRAVDFDDGGWAVGAAQLGYGDGDEATPLSYGGNSSNKIRTYYFRLEFSLANSAAYADLTLRVIRDDGAVVYLNGMEVARSNMAEGGITFNTFASSAIGGADESAWQEFAVDPALLQTTNVLAVEIHQVSSTSSDMSFDLELERSAPAVPVPVVNLDSPADDSVMNSTAVSFSCSASDPVGLQHATLQVTQGGSGGTVTVSGPAAMADAQISADMPNGNSGSGLSINVDGRSPHVHAVIQVPDLIGSGANRVPSGAVIEWATIEMSCTNPGNVMKLYRLLEEWVESEVTWNERQNGVAWAAPGADGAGSRAGVALDGDCTGTGQRTLDIAAFVQEWSDGAPNYGFVLTDGGTNGVDFGSSESGNPPVLTVVYQADGVVVTETKAMSGTSDAVTFTRTLADGQTYEWNCEVTNLSGGRASAPASFRVSVDTEAVP